MLAWTQLYLEPEASHGVLSREDRKQLAAILAVEPDEGVHRHGADILAGFSCAECAERTEHHVSGRRDVGRPLARWLAVA